MSERSSLKMHGWMLISLGVVLLFLGLFGLARDGVPTYLISWLLYVLGKLCLAEAGRAAEEDA